ncbi:Rv3235 family protein [Pseudonocardia xishanensis]|uniref:Uncharacterized protein n=1 Tax=Pseudonocardia xishanensis TaxID=630995 RepID=A0ABP8RCT0_9PSEU
MTITHDSEETTQDALRQALDPVRAWVWDGRELLPTCPTCGHRPDLPPPAPLPEGEPVIDVVADRAALREAARMVALLVDVMDQRRPPRQVRDLVHPRVLRYVAAVPADGSGSRGGARLLSVHPVQPHEGAVEVAAMIRLRGRRRALAASFEASGAAGWMCTTIRVL